MNKRLTDSTGKRDSQQEQTAKQEEGRGTVNKRREKGQRKGVNSANSRQNKSSYLIP